MPTELLMPTYKTQGNMKREFILSSKITSLKSAAQLNYGEGSWKTPHINL